MGKQESEAGKREIIRKMGMLAHDLEGLERDVSDEGVGKDRKSIWDFYIPRGLRTSIDCPNQCYKQVEEGRSAVWHTLGNARGHRYCSSNDCFSEEGDSSFTYAKWARIFMFLG
jgi:hypothetical protein